MNKLMTNRICALFLIISLLLSFNVSALELDAKGAYSVNCKTGEVYFEKNADELMTPASLTKIMTLYIVFEKMEAGEFDEETWIPISNHAARISTGTDATNIPLTEGYALQVKTLIDAMTIVSACACCTVIAEYISGSEDAFALLMTEKAKDLGLDAVFYDASGLSDDNLISPRSVGELVRLFITKYPRILDYTSKSSAVINGKRYDATNRLLPLKKTDYYYPGADGFKTGTTTKAGKCLAATAEKDGERVVTVAMKTRSNDLRYIDSTKLLNDAFHKLFYFGKNLFSTDIRAFINGEEIPCCYRMVGEGELCITAEHLNRYGFDTHFDAETHTLYISENKEKETSPIECEKLEVGLTEHKVYDYPELKAVLLKGDEELQLKTAISLGGQCAISIDELGRNFQKEWNGEERTVSISTKGE